MASPFENVAEQALSLSAAERLRLATELLESVEPSGSKEEVERAWEQEMQRRITDGQVRGRQRERLAFPDTDHLQGNVGDLLLGRFFERGEQRQFRDHRWGHKKGITPAEKLLGELVGKIPFPSKVEK